MDPFSWILGGLGIVGSLFGNLFNSSSQQQTNSDNIKFQREENEKNRQYNSAEAAISRNFMANFSREMYNRQYNDNSIQSQMAQYKSSGVNPALAFSSSSFQGASPLSVGSSAASSSGSISPNVAPQLDPLSLAQVANLNAQTQKIKADTEGQEHQNDILASDAKFRDALNQGQLNLQNCNITLAESQSDLNDASAHKVRNEATLINNQCGFILDQIKLLESQIANLDQDTIGKRIDNLFKSDHWRAQIDNLASMSKLSKAQVTSILSKLPLEIEKLGTESAVNYALSSLTWNQSFSLGLKNESDKIDLDIKKITKGGPISKHILGYCNAFGDVLRALAGGVGSASVGFNSSSSTSVSTLIK